MPVLFQLFQTSSFALPFGTGYRHVAYGLRGTAHCHVPAGEYCKCHAGETKEDCEQRTEVNEPAVAQPPASGNRGTAASEEVMMGICGASGAFIFHLLEFGFVVNRILAESRRCRPRYGRGGCFEFKRPQDAGKVVVAVGLNLVKLFQR